MALRVGYDVTPTIAGMTGVARYVTELGRALVSGEVALRRYAIGRAWHSPPAGTRWVRVPLRLIHAAWRLGVGAPDRWLGEVDLVHATDLVPPPCGVPLVLTVHDLLALDLPDLHPDRAVRVQRDTVAHLGRARTVLVPSVATGDAVRLRAPEADVHVTPLAGFALPAPAPITPPEGPVVVHVGGLVPRKDLPTAVAAIAACRRPVHLVLVGPDGPAREEVLRTADRLGVRDRVHIVGRIDDTALAGWYAAADVVVTTTVGEGFGLPVLEALKTGAPVVASALPVLREVGGDAVTYAEPGEPEAFAAAIDGALVAGRETGAEQRRRRAERFSWDATAAATMEAYHRAAGT